MGRIRARWWLLSGVALVPVVGAITAQQLLPLRSLLDLNPDIACTPTLVSSRYPGHTASPQGQWQFAAEPYPARRDEIRAASAGGTIYVGSGLTSHDGRFVSLNELFRFEPRLGSYEELPDIPVRVDHSAFVTHSGALYVIGGYVNGRPTGSVWRLSPATQAWAKLASLHVPRGSVAAAVTGGQIYVVGGSRGPSGKPEPVSTLEIYDLGAGVWRRGPDMPTPRHHHGAAIRDGRLVVVGGRGDTDLSLDTVEQFDPATRRWRALRSLPLGVGGLAVVGAGGSVIAIGGGDDEERWVTPATWALAPGADDWRRLADLNVARHGHGAAAIGSEVYVFGGAPCPGYGRSDEVESLEVSPP